MTFSATLRDIRDLQTKVINRNAIDKNTLVPSPRRILRRVRLVAKRMVDETAGIRKHFCRAEIAKRYSLDRNRLKNWFWRRTVQRRPRALDRTALEDVRSWFC